MEKIFIYILFASGIYNIIFNFFTTTRNNKSTLLFKVIPFLFALSNIILGLYLLNIIVIK